jgi:hypothetical protein
VTAQENVFRFEGDAEARRLSSQALDRELGLDGLPPDPVAATRLLRAAAERGHIRAAISFSLCLRDGTGTAPDAVAAAALLDRTLAILREAAELGDPVADVILADVFERGLGVAKSRAAAHAHLRRASAGQPAPVQPLGLVDFQSPARANAYMARSAADRCDRLAQTFDADEHGEADRLYAELVGKRSETS